MNLEKAIQFLIKKYLKKLLFSLHFKLKWHFLFKKILKWENLILYKFYFFNCFKKRTQVFEGTQKYQTSKFLSDSNYGRNEITQEIMLR